jgi:CBS domain-containing protein
LEQEFNKKKPSNSSRTLGKNKRIAGTVSALRPGQALTVKESMLVMESAQLMAAKRCDCVLVIDDDDHLSGIFTVKYIIKKIRVNNKKEGIY